MLKTQNKRLLKLLPFILTICSLSYIVRTFEINSLFISFNSYFSILFLLLLGFLSVSLQNFIIAKRWLLISKFFGGKSSLKNLFYAISYSCFLNQFLPASIAGDAYRSYFQKSSGSSLYKGFSTVFMDRVIGLLSLIIISSLSILFVPLNLSYKIVSILTIALTILLFFYQKVEM